MRRQRGRPSPIFEVSPLLFKRSPGLTPVVIATPAILAASGRARLARVLAIALAVVAVTFVALVVFGVLFNE